MTAAEAPVAKSAKRGKTSYVDQRNELKLWSGLLPYFQREFDESRELLLGKMSAQCRLKWESRENLGDLCNTFEDLLTAAGVTTYSDGSTAFLGAYMSFFDFTAAKVVCAEFSDKELQVLQSYYERQQYLSPIFGLVKGSCRDELARRAVKAEVLEKVWAQRIASDYPHPTDRPEKEYMQAEIDELRTAL